MTATLPSTPTSAHMRWLALAASLTTFALIVVGGMGRVLNAGLRCGMEWPLCNGALWPAPDLFSVVAWAHRGLALLVLMLVIALTLWVMRDFRAVRWLVRPVWLALGLLLMQIGLGAATVQLRIPSVLVAVHFGVSLALLAALIVVTVVAFQLKHDPHLGDTVLQFDVVSRFTGLAALAVFGTLALGATVTAFHAGAACAEWPLCDGAFWPANGLGLLVMAHRYAAAFATGLVLYAAWQAWRWRSRDVPVPVTAAITTALLFAQSLVGAQMTLNAFPVFMAALHVATGVAVWASVVVLVVLALQYTRLAPLKFALPAARPHFRAALADYFMLTKPIIMVLLLVTTACAMVVAGHGWPPLDLFGWTMLGGALASGGASALNQVIDRHLDQHMTRTARRPIADGRISVAGGLAFGLVLSIASFYVLAVFVNGVAAVWAVIGNIYYVWGYTILLKKNTVQNIVIGGGAGAVPPLVGWAAVTGNLAPAAWFLFALVFFWTPPHFWALALLKRNDYARAGVPMLPVVVGEAETRWHILLYTVLVVALSLLLTPAQVAGWFYLLVATVLGAVFIAYAVQLYREGGNKMAWRLYKYSSLYLALMFVALVADQFVWIG